MNPKLKTISCLMLVLCGILFGCKGKLEDKSYNINVKIEDTYLLTSNIFSKVEVFTFEDIFLGRINKIIEHNDLIYIHTSTGDRRIHIYDKSKGKTINSIASIGKGPSEFQSVRNIFIFENNFYAFDYMKKNLHKYDLLGNDQIIIKLPDYAEDVNFIDSTTIVLFKKGRSGPDSKGEYKINTYKFENNKFVLKNQVLSLVDVEEERVFSQLNTLFRFNNKLLLTEPFANKFIEINNESIKNFIDISFGQYQLPYNEYNNNSLNLSEFIRFCKTSDNIWNINNVLTNGRYIFFTFYHKEQLYSNLHNMTNHETITYLKFHDDQMLQLQIPTNSFRLDLKPVCMSEDGLLFIIEPSHLANIIENSITGGEISKRIRNSNIVIDKLGNPILLKYYFTKN